MNANCIEREQKTDDFVEDGFQDFVLVQEENQKYILAPEIRHFLKDWLN